MRPLTNSIKKNLNISKNLLIISISACCFATSVSGITIKDALKQKLITLTVRSNDGRSDSLFRPSFYNECILFEVKNLKSTSIQLTEDVGRFLMPDDSSLQRMMVTSQVSFALGAYQKKEVPVYAMCTEASDGGPSTTTHFDYGAFAEGKLLTLVKMIATNNYQNSAAQHAIWCVTDGYSPYSIHSEDSTVTQKLRKFTCELVGVKYDPKGERDAIQLPHFRHVTGDFYYTIATTHVVNVKVYNQQGQLMTELVKDEKQKAGSYQYRYEVDVPVNDDANPPTIILKFYLDGKLFHEKRHVLGG